MTPTQRSPRPDTEARRSGAPFRAVLLGLALCAAVLAACTATVSGHANRGFFSAPTGATSASASPTAGPPSPSDSSATAAPTDPNLVCPHITHQEAFLSYDCVNSNMQLTIDQIWPLAFGIQVEPTWQLNEGSGKWGPPNGQTLSQIAAATLAQVLGVDEYGTDPTTKTVSDVAATVDAHQAQVLTTLVTINPTYAASKSLKVRAETSTIVAIAVSPTVVSLWFVSVPDEAAALVPDVNKLIASIKVIS